MATPTKADKLTTAVRVEEVLNVRLAGGEFHDLRDHAAKAGWNVSDRQLWRYVRSSDALLARTLEKDRQRLINRHRAMRYTLFARAIAVNDLSNARAILRDLAELEGLYPTKPLELSGQVIIQTLAGIDENEVLGIGHAITTEVARLEEQRCDDAGEDA